MNPNRSNFFCVPLPDLEAKTVEEVKPQFVAGFGNVDLDIEPNEDRKKMSRLKVMTAVCRLRE